MHNKTLVITFMEMCESFDVEIQRNPVQVAIERLQAEGARLEAVMDLIEGNRCERVD